MAGMDTPKIETLWSHLHWLVVLEEQGSYTAAATRLGVSKAAMSQHIAELERAAGVPLVRRTTRSMRLTEAGNRLVSDARGAFEDLARSFANVQDTAGVPTGLLRVTAPVALTRQQLLPRLPDFLRAFPEVRLELEMSDRLSSLSLEGMDLAIRHATTVPDTHVAWPLCSTRSILAASPAYLRSRGAPEHPAELRLHDCLHYPRSQDRPAWTFEQVEPERSKQPDDEGRVTVPVTGQFAANNSEALREAALAGLGIALLPDFSAQESLEGGQLVEVMPAWRPVGTYGDRIFAIRAYSPHVPRAVDAFVGFLRQSLAGGFGARTA